MTLLNLVKFLRESILDDIGGTGVVWQDITEDLDEAQQLRWTNEELTGFINEGIRKACQAAMLIKDEQAAFDITIVADQADYSIDDRILEILRIYYDSDSKALVKAEIEDIWNINNWRNTTGRPTHYVVDYNTNTIKLYPKPTADDVEDLHIFATRLPLTDLDWEQAETDTPELRSSFDMDIVNYAAHLAYLKDEANTFDPQRSEYFRTKFEREFGHLSHYGSVRRSRTKNKNIGYGGL